MEKKDPDSSRNWDNSRTKNQAIQSKDLFACDTRVKIQYGDTEYLPQVTQQGKLILTK